MKLIDLSPGWLGTGGEGVRDKDGNPVPRREGVALSFICPCGGGERVSIMLRNPLDGGPPVEDYEHHSWQRMGEAFETLTLTPSLQRNDPGGCRWHGFITNGEIINA